jgi:hypothetical protein
MEVIFIVVQASPLKNRITHARALLYDAALPPHADQHISLNFPGLDS